MARMYPEVFPRKFDSNDPEFIVYQSLKRLPDNYVVLYSKRVRGGLFGQGECEIDFIVTNQRDVVICLEVKGGLLAYDGRNDQWAQNGKVMERSPDRQATSASHALMRALIKELRNANVDWALCFPQCSVAKGHESLSVPPERIIDETKLLNIVSEIERLEQDIRRTFNKKGMTSTESRNLVERLTRGIGFVQILGVRIARESEQIIQVTEEQCGVLADLEINSRMIIHGAAGTGKTILAQEFAKRLETNDKQVLLLFYNKSIAAKVRGAFDKRGKVQVSTFSSFAKRLIEEVDQSWWNAHDTRNDDFWHLELPSRLLEIPNGMLPKFDAVIVDEGQDFKPEWFEFLQKLLPDRAETFFTVFLDEHQDIFGHWKYLPCSVPPAKKVLTKNCRNTRSIVDYLNGIYPTGMTSFERSPVGLPIVERNARNAIDEQTQVVRDVKHLINNEQIAPGAIVILLDTAKQDSCLAETRAIAGLPLESTYTGYDLAARKIYYATIDIFKGLEADVVLLVLSRPYQPRELPNAIYVRGSRAKHLLYIYNRAST
jgi:Nuclease-related domain/AAA domain